MPNLDKFRVPIWERQEDEPTLAYTRFVLYKLLGPGRSLLGAYNQERKDKKQAKTTSCPPFWRKAMDEWHWKARAEAWDRRNEEKLVKSYERKYRVWENRRQEVRFRNWGLSEALVEKAEQMLEMPLKRTKIKASVKEIDSMEAWDLKAIASALGATGLRRRPTEEIRSIVWDLLEKEFKNARRAENIIIIEPTAWSMRDAAAYLDTAQRLAEQAIEGSKKIDELDALRVLIDAGWIPDNVIDVASDQIEELKAIVRNTFKGSQKAMAGMNTPESSEEEGDE